MNKSSPATLVDLASAWQERFGSPLPRSFCSPLEKLLGIRTLNSRYSTARSLLSGHPGGHFPWRDFLAAWELDYKVAEAELERIPRDGPLLLVSNHPFGFADGLVLSALLARRRSDFKIIANQHFGRLPEFGNMILPVNNYGGPLASRENRHPLKEALRHLRRGGALATFPAGEVSSLQGRSGISDGPWHPNTARLVRMSGAAVVPVFFHGSNGILFHLAGLFNPALRTALLPREFVKGFGRVLLVRVGNPIPASRISGEDDARASAFLRATTYALAARPVSSAVHTGASTRKLMETNAKVPPSVGRQWAELAPSVDSSLLSKEVEALAPSATLVVQGHFRVFVAPSWKIPLLLRQIGRERERAFRQVGEGSGLSRDLDRHDRSYLHLVLWDSEKLAVAGAYRLGRSDKLLPRLGLDGLYSHSLFRFRPEFFAKTGPVLELGRSFVAPEYQRKPQSLHLLWRGLGEFVVRNPRYRHLLGPVSMSADYEKASLALVTAALASRWVAPELAALVSPLRPPGLKFLPTGLAGILSALRDEGDLSGLVSTIQPDNSGLPILLKHYLRLNAKAVACSVDPSFGNCLDALIIVDLIATEPKMLERYLGLQGAENFRRHHLKPHVVDAPADF